MTTILHPTYFPNIAHFVAMAQAKNVIFEVEDNYQKQTFRNRTVIYAANGALVLSIPIVFSQKNRQKSKDVKIANHTNWQLQHWKSLQSAYRTSPFFEFYEDDILPLFTNKEASLLDFNFKCLEVILDCLQLDLKFTKTQSYNKTAPQQVDLRALVNTSQKESYQFETYTQVFNNKHGFLNNLSVLDLLFNEGTNALNYLQTQPL